MQFEDPALVLDALSHRVLRHLSASAWRKLFLRPHDEVMRFAPIRGTLLCAAAQMPPWHDGAGVQQEVEFLARSHGGEVDPCPHASALVRFDDPQAALQMALELQQSAGDVRYQVALASGDCLLATLQLEDKELRVLVGGAVDRVEAVMRLATPGSVRLAPETFAHVQDVVLRMGHCMVTTEFEGEEITATSLLLPPRSSAQLSTFAGLGLT